MQEIVVVRNLVAANAGVPVEDDGIRALETLSRGVVQQPILLKLKAEP